MSKVSQGLTINQSTDAAFRVWGSQVKAALAAAGLTQTSDTGQIDWTTVTRAAGNTDAGYEIWRISDTHQATRPIFFKFRYGSTSVNDRERLYVDIGEGSNGAGSLTGAIKADLSLITASNSATGTADFNVCYNATLGYVAFAITNIVGTNINYSVLSCERLKDATGAATNRGFAVVRHDLNQALLSYFTFASAWSTEPGNPNLGIPIMWPQQSGGVSSAGGTFVSGLTPLTGNGTHGVLERTLGFLGVGYNDFTVGEQMTVTRWDGNAHTYLCMGTYGGQPMSNNAQSAYVRHAILWE